MSQPFDIGLAADRDVDSIAVMSRDLVESGVDWFWTPNRVRRALRRTDTIVPVARVGSAMAGFALIRVGFEEAHLDLLAVRPGRRRQGIGRTLVAWLEESVLVAGVGVVRVRVRTSRPAVQSFFRSLGYVPRPKPEDAKDSPELPMAHDLWCPPVVDEVR